MRDDEMGDETADRLGRELVRVFKLFERAAAQYLPTRGDGVERAAYRLLAALVVTGPHRTGALAQLVHSDPSTVSRQVAGLVRLGHLERIADPEDGRATLIVATPLGRETFGRHRARRNEYLATVTRSWSRDEVDALTVLLARLATDIEGFDPHPDDGTLPRPRLDSEDQNT